MKSKLSKAAMEFFKEHGSQGGKIGGCKTSKAKKKAARANGKLGGRPKKEEGNPIVKAVENLILDSESRCEGKKVTRKI